MCFECRSRSRWPKISKMARAGVFFRGGILINGFVSGSGRIGIILSDPYLSVEKKGVVSVPGNIETGEDPAAARALLVGDRLPLRLHLVAVHVTPLLDTAAT
jgi:hypothetical protein